MHADIKVVAGATAFSTGKSVSGIVQGWTENAPCVCFSLYLLEAFMKQNELQADLFWALDLIVLIDTLIAKILLVLRSNLFNLSPLSRDLT